MPGIALEKTAERLTVYATRWLKEALRAGAYAVDATVGNGYDTLFLAHEVGPQGHVLGFDVQKVALTNATEMLRFTGLLNRVTLVLASHEELRRYLPPGQQITAAMFNLGYLPRGDRRIITRPASTLKALSTATAHLEPRGRITILSYRGHGGGEEEYVALSTALASEPAIHVTEVAGVTAAEDSPRLFLIQRRSSGG
ncbi:MAG: methyltransferase domain-containing protein [Verrucomicrobia bacterium]|nr:methyltransferase domain-containing protein [Verrucomicrobiota bacterium]